MYRGSYGDTSTEKSEKDESAEDKPDNGYYTANYAYARFYFFDIVILFFVFHTSPPFLFAAEEPTEWSEKDLTNNRNNF